MRAMSKPGNAEIERKKALLERIIADAGSAVVAFSGGVDSTLLAYVAHRVLGEKMIAVTSDGEAYPDFQTDDARKFAAGNGIPHMVMRTRELDVPEFAANQPDRCYHCKKKLLGEFLLIAEKKGFRWVFEGTNADDGLDYRPGRRAVEELGVRSPLAEASLTKAEIREISKQEGLPTWDLPAYACLASRFPYGTAIDSAKLKMIERAEAAVRELGFRQFRVRYHGDVARIEISPDELEGALQRKVLARMSEGVKAAGFKYVAVDVDGYRMGSMNIGLDKEAGD